MCHIAYRRWAIALVLGLLPPAVNAVTYYVDAGAGNDAWNGRQAAASSPNAGPWQTFARVASATLQPGDSVLLKCGQVWRETLALNNSGTAANPITVGSYPSACQTPPRIDGSHPIPSHSWIKHSGSIYRAVLPANLVANSTFDSGTGGWLTWSPANDATIAQDTNCAASHNPCMRLGGGSAYSVALSNNFALDGGARYTLSFSMKAPAGVRIRAILRRGVAPWDWVGVSDYVTGTGAWQAQSIAFLANTSLSNARLDFEVPPGASAIYFDNVRVQPATTVPTQVFAGGQALQIAHHPNRGYDLTHPESLYLKIAANSAVTTASGKNVSQDFAVGTDFGPYSGALTAGTTIRIRTDSWIMEERRVARFDGSKITLDAPTSFPLQAGWGYYLLGQLWMLDSPGEWYFDTGTSSLYVWMLDGAAPVDRVAFGDLSAGIQADGQSHIVIDGIAIRRVGTGISIRSSVAVTVRNCIIEDTADTGINAALSNSGVVEHNQVARTGADALSLSADEMGVPSTGMRVTGNTISNSGVVFENGVISSLPRRSYAAIRPGRQSIVENNELTNAGYVGIWPQHNSLVRGNIVRNTCLVLDDCGAILVNGANHDTVIADNLVSNIPGALSGKPGYRLTEAQGIYLDEPTSNVTVSGNTVIDADNGILIHNATNNRIEHNTVYANRRYQIWMLEQSNRLFPGGDVVANQIIGNRLFPTTTGASVGLESEINSTVAFGSFDGNRYGSLLSQQVVSEIWPTGGASHTLPQWKLAVDSHGMPRNQEPTGTQVAGIGYSAFRTAGSSLVPNGNLIGGITGWTGWNQNAPQGQVTRKACPPGYCMHYVAGGSWGIVSSPNFSVVKDRWYRVSFDLQTGTDNQPVSVVVRRGGGGTNGYEYVMGAEQNIVGATSWKRFSFAFQATKTINANDPATHDLGARLDFIRILPGQEISATNLELIPLSPVEASLRTNILLNPTEQPITADCPDQAIEPAFCSQYVRFIDGTPIGWPYIVPAHRSEIVFSRDVTLTDADGDGIADSQDICAATPDGDAVNSRGCSFAQSYPAIH